ncbi:hypothetical protein EV182_004498 [Spiromyces aspiralis]|uniref:Uncharacterized protein n=1 Tax=Spiromyces aspiralis TaxID=68401 RepID=A0ACC1HT01_9FUNG|nr:hypothetical protein EV182_004498 [Spiromyces aspiralis]
MPASLQKKSAVAYNVSASDDQVIEELAGAGKTRVFATDVVLATLMVAPRTVQPWDIVINRVEDRLYLDKRDGGPLDYLTVNENAVDPPSEGVDKSSINAPAMLAQEANEINRQFIAQVASNKAGGEKFERENPFVNEPEDDEKTVAAYRYRLFDLSAKQVVGEREGGAAGEEDNEEEGEEEADKCIMAVRTELNAVDKGPNDHEAYLFVRALNQFDPRAAGAGGALDWRTKMQSNRGAVVATERKNNSAKLAKWSLQAMMSDAAYLKLGYVGRADPSKRTAHKVYTVEKYKPTDLLKHLNVNVENAWGIAKAFIDLCLTLPEGRYVLVRDPIKPSMLLYAVPQGTFDNVDEDEDEDEEAGENVTSGGAVSGAGVSPAGKAL